MHDDSVIPSSEWEPIDHISISYVGVKNDRELIGIFIVAAHSLWLWELHMAFLPEYWGPLTIQAGREFIRWIWKETACQRLFGQIVETNRLSLSLASRCGMKIFGVHPKSFMKDDKMRDQILVGISRPGGA